MFQIRIHGRGGQGVVTAAEMLSVAAFLEGRTRRRFRASAPSALGAPVVAFCRIADKEIRLREPILEPDCLIVQDPTLFKAIDVFAGPASRTAISSSTPTRRFADLHIADRSSRACRKATPCIVPATELALKHVGRPLPNAALLGAFAALTGTRPSRQRATRDRADLSRQDRRGECRGGARRRYEFVTAQATRRQRGLRSCQC